jgi:hypothetical protein
VSDDDFINRDFSRELYLVHLAAKLEAGTATDEETLEAANLLSRGAGAHLGLEYKVYLLEREVAGLKRTKPTAIPEDLDVEPSPRISYLLTEIEVSYLPRDNPNYRYFKLQVRRRYDNRFGIYSGESLYNRNGDWDYGRPPEDPDELQQWREDHFFEYEEAVQRAALLAPDVEINGTAARSAANLQADGYFR